MVVVFPFDPVTPIIFALVNLLANSISEIIGILFLIIFSTKIESLGIPGLLTISLAFKTLSIL